MAVAFVQRLAHNTVAASQNTLGLTLTVSATAGDAVAVAAKASSGGALSSVTDSKGNTYVVAKSSAASGARAHLAYTLQDVGTLVSGDVITLHWASALADCAAAAFEYSGVAASSPVDQTQSGSGSSVTTVANGTTGTTTQAAEVALTVLAAQFGQTSVTVPSGYTERDTVEKNGANSCVAFAEKVRTTTGTEAPSWSWGTSANAGTVVVTYKAVTKQPLVLNNYQFVTVGDGMSTSEKIR